MKFRDLKLRSGKGWPPRWVEFSGKTEAVAEEGVLEGIERLGNRLLLRINVNGRRRTASVEWDPKPGVGAVEPAERVVRLHQDAQCRRHHLYKRVKVGTKVVS